MVEILLVSYNSIYKKKVQRESKLFRWYKIKEMLEFRWYKIDRADRIYDVVEIRLVYSISIHKVHILEYSHSPEYFKARKDVCIISLLAVHKWPLYIGLLLSCS